MKEKIYFILKIIAILAVFLCGFWVLNKSFFDSDDAVISLMANDILETKLPYKNWYNGGPLYITTTLPFFVISAAFFKVHTNTLIYGYFLTIITAFISGILLLNNEIKKIDLRSVALYCILASVFFVSLASSYFHVSIAIFSFLALFLFKKYFETNKIIYAYFASFLVAFALISDFSIGAFFVLPIVIYSVVKIYRNYKNHENFEKYAKTIWLLSIFCMLSFILYLLYVHFFNIHTSDTRFFSQKFIPIDKIAYNFKITILSLLEVQNANFFGKIILKFETFMCALRLFVLCMGVYFSAISLRDFFKNKDSDLINSVLSLAFAIYLFIFLFTDLNTDVNSKRYLFHLPFLFAILITRKINELKFMNFKWENTLMVLLFFGFLNSAINFTQIDKIKKYRNLSNYLIENNLKYGRALYWDAEVITVLSSNKTKIHSITIDDDNRFIYNYRWFCNIDWFDDPVEFIVTRLDNYPRFKNMYKYKKIVSADDFIVLILEKPFYINHNR